MKILIPGLKKNIQLERLKEEGSKRGHMVDGCYGSEIVISCSHGEFEPTVRGKALKDYDLLYLMVTRSRWEWYVASRYLSEKYNTKIVSRRLIDGPNLFLTPTWDYLHQVENKLPFPKSTVVLSYKSVDAVISGYSFPLIMKLSNSQQGRGVHLVKSKEELVEKIKENKDKADSFIIREFIPNDGDIRVFTVGYRAIGAMRRIPKTGDFRSNISQGGSGEEFDLKANPEVREIAERISELLKIEVAGVDIMINKETKKPFILEVNANPQFAGLEQYTKTNAALEMIKYFESLF